MAIRSGYNFLIKHPTSTGTTIAALRATSYSINNETIDVTTKDSTLLWRELLGGEGVHSVSLTGSGLVSTDTIHNTLLTAAINRTSTGYYLTDGSTQGALQGTFMFSNYSRAGDHNDADTFDFTLESAGVVNTTV